MQEITFEEFVAQGSVATCEVPLRCCNTAELAQLMEGATLTTETCPGVFQQMLEGDAQSRGIDASYSRYDTMAGATCLATVTGASCDLIPGIFDNSGNTEGCSQLFVGAVERGGACLDNDHCVDGVCMFADPSSTEGVCSVAHVLGESCEGGDCTRELTCTSDGLTSTCQARPTQGGACADAWVCADGFYCEAPDGMPGVCAPLKGAGEVCGGGSECLSGDCSDTCGPGKSADMCSGA